MRLKAIRELLTIKFGDSKISNYSSTNELMLAEARRTKKMYRRIFGPSFARRFDRNTDSINTRINIANNALYNYCAAVIHMLGYTLHLGILHGRTRNAFVFDLSELFKTENYYEGLVVEKPIREILLWVNEHCHTRRNILMEYLQNVFGTV